MHYVCIPPFLLERVGIQTHVFSGWSYILLRLLEAEEAERVNLHF